MKTIFRMFSAALLLFLSIDAHAASDPKLIMEEFMVPADPGISLYVRNKHPEGVTKFPDEKILLFVHGATYPAETSFDLQLNGLSWMDYIAQHGYDVYLVDVRGYGKSTRPPEMDKPAATDPVGSKQTPPVLRAPNGVVQDGREFWGAGKALYDPAEIRVPTFLAHAEWDADLPSYMLYAYFAKLTNAPYKRYVEIGEGTHTVIMEKNRMQLFHAVQQFLDERLKPNQ
jgi:alpha-beta hydrolase superfamily lysophospholipase